LLSPTRSTALTTVVALDSAIRVVVPTRRSGPRSQGWVAADGTSVVGGGEVIDANTGCHTQSLVVKRAAALIRDRWLGDVSGQCGVIVCYQRITHSRCRRVLVIMSHEQRHGLRLV
jgi:hypothetical protein